MKRSLLLVIVSLLYASVYGGDIDTVQIFSTAMDKDIPCVVIVPDQPEEKDVKYPVVYLLHGYSGNYLRWITRVPGLGRYADKYDMILVCPDGGYNSWYLDSPLDSTIRYETFLTKELIPYIDKHYPTIPDKFHRGICGESMGGFGALFIAIKHADEFKNVVSLSGCVDIRPFANNWQIKKRLGDIRKYPARWNKYTVINLVDSLKNGELNIRLDCGVDDIFIKENRALHQKLLRLYINHGYTERPGGHNWTYWRMAIPYQLLFFQKKFLCGKYDTFK